MKAHYDENSPIVSASNDRLETAVRAKLLEWKQAGLAEGTKAISTVIYEKATDENKTCEERLDDIIAFCKTGLAIKTEDKENAGE